MTRCWSQCCDEWICCLRKPGAQFYQGWFGGGGPEPMWMCLKNSLRSCLRLRIHLGEIGTAVQHDVEEVERSRKAVEKVKTNFNLISLKLIVVCRPGGLLPPTVQQCGKDCICASKAISRLPVNYLEWYLKCLIRFQRWFVLPRSPLQLFPESCSRHAT